MPWQSYVAKPLEIRAIRWGSPADSPEVRAVIGDGFFRDVNFASAKVFDRLHNDWRVVKAGDFIVCGTRDEFYPVDPLVMRDLYTVVEQAEAQPV